MMSKRKIVLLVAGIGCFWLLLNLFVDEVPDDSLTKTRMIVIQARLIDYYKDNSSLPDKLADLPESDEINNVLSIVDAWENPIGYRVEDGVVTLQSVGQDHCLGGTGMNKDIFLSFDPNTSEMMEMFHYSSTTDGFLLKSHDVELN